MATHDHKPRRFALSLVNAAEDVPRVLRAWGRCCGGEVALVLRPVEGTGALVHVDKGGEARFWRTPSGEVGDAPRAPETSCSAKDAVALVRTAQKAVPKAGPITLRGQWRGWLHCDGVQPRVELQRKLATYALLTIESHEGRWRWTVERTDKWFSRPGTDEGTSETLAKAIEAGLAQAMGLLGQACSFRDSRRRAAFDEGWAGSHPIRAAREGRDPTERMKERAPKGRRAKASEGEDRTPRARRKAKDIPADGGVPTTPGEAKRSKGQKRATKAAAADSPNAERPSSPRRDTPASDDLSDAEKDRLLMASFADAVKLALAEA